MIDSHCHIDGERFAADLPEVLARAREAGVVRMVCVGAGHDLSSARASVALAEREADVYATVGVHPHDVAKMTDGDWDELARLAVHPRVVGVGETGLDFHYNYSP